LKNIPITGLKVLNAEKALLDVGEVVLYLLHLVVDALDVPVHVLWA
jgi:hypothetical protein